MKLEIGTKVYSYQINYGSNEIVSKVGEVLKNTRGNMILFEDGTKIFEYSPTRSYKDTINKYAHGRVLLLEDNLAQAKQLFLEHEEEQLHSLELEIIKRKTMIKIIESM